ncbi:MAG: CBS domain-containing protein [Bacteroidetes bacterium]|nr:MAG: CBS domain-containing protein [Bacteroidota bacterium]
MGEQLVNTRASTQAQRTFIRNMLNEVRALELMLEQGMFETGVQRIGAEQEFSLVDQDWQPALTGPEILEHVQDPHFTSELGRFNLEINLDPQVFTGEGLSLMEAQLLDMLGKVQSSATTYGSRVLLAGILPTIQPGDLIFDNMTPNPRYKALSDRMYAEKGKDFEFYIQGKDELIAHHNTILYEACNTSFQVHLQVDPEDFVRMYNWSQAIAGPILAGMVNSPLLMGKRLWKETRIALFQQATDIRNQSTLHRERVARVPFGKQWLQGSVLELFKEAVAKYKVILTAENGEDALAMVAAGKTPRLHSLMLHNGTIYRWNRPCYGRSPGGKPHLRIECRYIPAGPTVADEMANMAFWLGVMRGMPKAYHALPEEMDFDEVRHNFFKAARHGLGAQFTWRRQRLIPARDLILNELLPIARAGLEAADILPADITRYLDIIEDRVREGRTGARWWLDTFHTLRKEKHTGEALVAATASAWRRQESRQPVHNWTPVKLENPANWRSRFWRIRQIMSTDLFTVQEEDPLDLAMQMMEWHHIHHIPVENARGEVVGILSTAHLLKNYCPDPAAYTAGEIMTPRPITIEADANLQEGIRLMGIHQIGCLPVLHEGKLVGIVTEKDIVRTFGYILEDIAR